MSTQPTEHARYITKPIQLWAFYFAFLAIIIGVFLHTAENLPQGWERSALVIASVTFVPITFIAMVIMQIWFRDQMQSDEGYQRSQKSKSRSSPLAVPSPPAIDTELEVKLAELVRQLRSVEGLSSPDNVGKASPANWSQWKVSLNKTHPQYSEIKAELKRHDIEVYSAFGDASPPNKWIVSINEKMPKKLSYDILLIFAAKFNFDGFMFWNPIREIGEAEDVYIGSYGAGSYIKFSAAFEAATKSTLSMSEYMVAYQANM